MYYNCLFSAIHVARRSNGDFYEPELFPDWIENYREQFQWAGLS